MISLLREFEKNINNTGIIGDIGGTNARFALVTPQGIIEERKYQCKDFHSFYALLETYITDINVQQSPVSISLGVAGPVSKEKVRMTNLAWDIDGKTLKSRFGFKHAQLMNDFVAVAQSVRHLEEGDYEQLGDGYDRGGNVAVIGPGTGLGFAAISRGEKSDIIIPGEVEDADMFFTGNGAERNVLDIIKTQFDRPLTNSLITGRGLVVLYNAVCINSGSVSYYRKPSEVADAALGLGEEQKPNPQAREALNMFWSFLGRASGNLASTVSATGGVYIAGGIVPRLFEDFKNSRFTAEFEDKGPRGLTSKIPTYVITAELPAFLGLRASIASTLK